MASIPEFLLVAVVVTLTPGPATAMIVRVAARDGRRAALSAIVGNSAGVLLWGLASAVGVSSLILASQIAYDALRIGGAAVLVGLGIRSLIRGRDGGDERAAADVPVRHGWKAGLVTSASNPKLAVFFVALFPQFVTRGSVVLPYALAMAAVIVVLDVIWYSALACAVDRARSLLAPRVQRRLERLTGVVMVGLGLRLAAEVR